MFQQPWVFPSSEPHSAVAFFLPLSPQFYFFFLNVLIFIIANVKKTLHTPLIYEPVLSLSWDDSQPWVGTHSFLWQQLEFHARIQGKIMPQGDVSHPK